MQILVEQKLKYLTRRKSEVEQLKECVSQDNFDLVGEIGHRLKGNGGTFGFPRISAIGLTLEDAAKAKDKTKLLEGIEKLSMIIEEDLKLISHT